MSEDKTNEIVREHFKKEKKGKYKDLIIEEKISADPIVDDLLSTASKKGTGKKGFPEFILRIPFLPTLLILVEDKRFLKDHNKGERDIRKYMKACNAKFDIIGLAVSGTDIDTLKVTAYLWLKDTKTKKKLDLNGLAPLEEYIKLYLGHPKKTQQTMKDTKKIARKIHKRFRKDHGLTENQISLFVSGVLIALKDKIFKSSYHNQIDSKSLIDFLMFSIRTVLDGYQGLSKLNMDIMMKVFSFMSSHIGLVDIQYLSELKLIMDELKEKISPYMITGGFDVVTEFYKEFLRYTNSQGKLGIAITPTHFVELMLDLYPLTYNDIFGDICFGTDTFSMIARKKMIKSAKNIGRYDLIPNIDNNIFGIEKDPVMFTLGMTNSILSGDGKTNKHLGNSISIAKTVFSQIKATFMALNPAYSLDVDGYRELDFVLVALENQPKNGHCVCIIPLSCARESKILKERLLKNNRLDFVISLPDNTFPEQGVIPCIMGFTAGIPHPQDYYTWFARLKDDGFVSHRVLGRCDLYEKWQDIKKEFLKAYKQRIVGKEKYAQAIVSVDDDWSPERFILLDYSLLTEQCFVDEIRKYVGNMISIYGDSTIVSKFQTGLVETLDTGTWKSFRLPDVFLLVTSTNLKDDIALRDLLPGEIPVISTTARNNGIAKFAVNAAKEQGKKLTIACRGSCGFVTYQDNPFNYTTNIALLKTTVILNVYIGLFIATVFNNVEKKLFDSFGRIASQKALNEIKLRLPVDSNGDVDYNYMERFMKGLKVF